MRSQKIEPKGTHAEPFVDELHLQQDGSLATHENRTNEGSKHTMEEGKVAICVSKGANRPKPKKSKDEVVQSVENDARIVIANM